MTPTLASHSDRLLLWASHIYGGRTTNPLKFMIPALAGYSDRLLLWASRMPWGPKPVKLMIP